MGNPELKQCRTCGVKKPNHVNFFEKQGRGGEALRKVCRVCRDKRKDSYLRSVEAENARVAALMEREHTTEQIAKKAEQKNILSLNDRVRHGYIPDASDLQMALQEMYDGPTGLATKWVGLLEDLPKEAYRERIRVLEAFTKLSIHQSQRNQHQDDVNRLTQEETIRQLAELMGVDLGAIDAEFKVNGEEQP